MRRISALLLLLVLGFSLSAGAHPCGGEEAAPSSTVQEASPACHGAAQGGHGMKMPKAAAPAHSDQVSPGEGKGCCDPQQADHPCVHACHLVAVSSASPAAFSVVPVAAVQAVAPVIAPRSPVRSIDHIPLP